MSNHVGIWEYIRYYIIMYIQKEYIVKLVFGLSIPPPEL